MSPLPRTGTLRAILTVAWDWVSALIRGQIQRIPYQQGQGPAGPPPTPGDRPGGLGGALALALALLGPVVVAQADPLEQLPPGSAAALDGPRLRTESAVLAALLREGPGSAEPGAGSLPTDTCEYLRVDVAQAFVYDAAILGAGAALDLYTTAYALHENPNAYESNPAGFDVEARMALKLAAASGLAVASWQLRKHGHRRWADVARWGGLAISIAAAVNNIHVARGK